MKHTFATLILAALALSGIIYLTPELDQPAHNAQSDPITPVSLDETLQTARNTKISPAAAKTEQVSKSDRILSDAFRNQKTASRCMARARSLRC